MSIPKETIGLIALRGFSMVKQQQYLCLFLNSRPKDIGTEAGSKQTQSKST